MHITRHLSGPSFRGRGSRHHTSSSYSSSNDGDDDDVWSTTATAGGFRSRSSRQQSHASSSSSTTSTSSNSTSSTSSSDNSSSDDSETDLWSTTATDGGNTKNRKASIPDILDYCRICHSYEPLEGHHPRRAKPKTAINRRNSLQNTTNDGRRKVRFEEETLSRDYFEREEDVRAGRNSQTVPRSWSNSRYHLEDSWTIPSFRSSTRTRYLSRPLEERVKNDRLYGNGRCECWERVTVKLPGTIRRVRSFWGDGMVRVDVS
ncbi:hypothetical protein BZA77DRAFT_320158 [Pyronema omphalodes]|nr:hypothetical protein BZA77DRAFT_320158 [Pyronema omphalodes]